jgi:hypothetical protein
VRPAEGIASDALVAEGWCLEVVSRDGVCDAPWWGLA